MFVKALAEQCKARATAAIAAVAIAGLAANSARAELAGRIWSPAAGAFVEPDRVERAVRAADYVLLGETHTIARHHRLQARLLAAAAEHRRPSVVLEMVGQNRQSTIAQWRREGAQPGGFGAAVGWSKRGWPAWSMYQPIVEVAVRRELPLRAGGPGQALTRRVAREGLSALEPARRKELALDQPLPESSQRRLRQTLMTVHCGDTSHVPIDRMVAVQRLRDAVMAQRMGSGPGDGAVLIAGHGHTRRDYGVPQYLQSGPGEAHVVSVALMGSTEETTLEGLRERMHGGLAHDYVWFTDDAPPTADCPGQKGHSADG